MIQLATPEEMLKIDILPAKGYGFLRKGTTIECAKDLARDTNGNVVRGVPIEYARALVNDLNERSKHNYRISTATDHMEIRKLGLDAAYIDYGNDVTGELLDTVLVRAKDDNQLGNYWLYIIEENGKQIYRTWMHKPEACRLWIPGTGIMQSMHPLFGLPSETTPDVEHADFDLEPGRVNEPGIVNKPGSERVVLSQWTEDNKFNLDAASNPYEKPDEYLGIRLIDGSVFDYVKA